jgi:hypothetical protein
VGAGKLNAEIDMSTATLSVPRQASGWIINRSQDLTWFVCSALAGASLLILAWSFGNIPARIITLWWVVLDGPHVFSTSLRTVFDATERRKHKHLWLAALPLCSIGPLCKYFGVQEVFLLAMFLWSNFHIAKQHVGFVMLYRAKEKIRNRPSFEKWSVVLMLGIPILYFVGTKFGPNLLIPALVAGLLSIACYVFVARPSWIRFVYMILNCALWWGACIYSASDPASESRLLAATVAINVGHSLQYLRLNWFHNNNRYSARAGLLGSVSRKVLFFFATTFFVALPFRIIASFGGYLAMAAVGLLMLHFLLDARIWRVRGDKELANALRL